MALGLIPFLLLGVPIAEIAVFILVGDWIGLWPTLGMIVVTAFLGTLLLRLQGFQLVNEIRAKTDQGQVPGRALVHGAMLLVAGVLLLTPGFVTDTLGFLLFVPTVRDRLWQALKRHIKIRPMQQGPGARSAEPRHPRGPTIDLDETEFGPANPDTPWQNPRNSE